MTGPLWYVVVLLAVTLLSWRESAVGVAAVALMSGGDGLADLVGRRFGAAKLPYNKTKSWAGSTACFLGGRPSALSALRLEELHMWMYVHFLM